MYNREFFDEQSNAIAQTLVITTFFNVALHCSVFFIPLHSLLLDILLYL